MDEVVCQLCETRVKQSDLESHISSHLNKFPHRCPVCHIRCPTQDWLERHQRERGHKGDVKVEPGSTSYVADLTKLISSACEAAQNVGMPKVLEILDNNLASGGSFSPQPQQSNAEIFKVPTAVKVEWNPKGFQIQSGTGDEPIQIDSDVDPRDSLHTDSADKSTKKSDSMPNCPFVATLVESQLSEAELPIGSAVSRSFVQQANLPSTSSTPQLVSSAERRLESSKTLRKAEKQFGLMILHSTDVGNSDSSVRPTTSLSETTDDADNVRRSISSLYDRSVTVSPTEVLPDCIELMRIHLENPQVLMECHEWIDQYTWEMTTPLKRRLIEALLAVVKFHIHNDLIVETFYDLLWQIDVGGEEIDLCLDEIDCLMEVICGENNLALRTRESASKLLGKIARKSWKDQRNRVGQMLVVENICRSINLQLKKSEFDKKLEITWECVNKICWNSVGNQKRFLNAGGIGLIQRCYEKFHNRINLVYHMTALLEKLSGPHSLSIRTDLVTNENLEILWDIWRDSKSDDLTFVCSQIFYDFHSHCRTWPLAYPTREEVVKKLV